MGDTLTGSRCCGYVCMVMVMQLFRKNIQGDYGIGRFAASYS